jgi:hypothetical protein
MLVATSLESLEQVSKECLREKGFEEAWVSTCCLILLQCDVPDKLSCQNSRWPQPLISSSCNTSFTSHISYSSVA